MIRFVQVFAASATLLTVLSGLRLGLSWQVVLSSALTTLVLWLSLEISRSHGFRLVLVLTTVYAGVSFINTLTEAVLFQVLGVARAIHELGGGTLSAFAVASVMVITARRWGPAGNGIVSSMIRKQGLAWRLPLIAICYGVLYMAAGMAIHPFIRDFYNGRILPGLSALIWIQLLRGAIYIFVALPWLRTVESSRQVVAFRLGLIFSILGGVAPLLVAGSYMPAGIRWAHALEIGVSNFLFGMAMGYLLLTEARPEANSTENTTLHLKHRPGILY